MSRRFLRFGAAVGALLLLTGWMSGRPGIALVDLESGRQQVRTAPGRFNETPIDVSESAKTFRTLQRTGGNTIVLRTVDFEGRTRNERSLPIFDRIFENYGSTQTYAVAPDGNTVVYLDGSSRELRRFDFSSRKSRVLATNVTSTPHYLAFLYALADGGVLAGAHVPETAENDRILLVNPLASAVEVLDCPPAIDTGKSALSPSRRTLACWEGFGRSGLDGQFILYDLPSRSRVGAIQSLSGGWLSQPHWSAGGHQLAYVEGARRILFHSLADQSSFLAFQGATNELVFLYAFGNREVLYKTYDPKKNDLLKRPLRIRDVYHGREREIANVRINGPVFLVENGTRLIAKVGF
jgi:hypothetical protein